MQNKNARVLVYDIETAAAIGLFFGKTYDANIAMTVQHEYVMGFAWQWLGESKVNTCYIWDFYGYNKPIKPKDMFLSSVLEAWDERIQAGSKEVVRKWCELVKEAQIIVGHNSDQFDYRQMNGRVMQHKLPPIPKPLQVDTKKIAKRVGYYQSNKLDDLSKRFNHGGKLQHDGIEMWWKCMNGDKKAQRHMVKYNKIDVIKTRELYEDFKPYDERHPNMANLEDRPDACRLGCEGFGFVSAGWKYTRTGKYRRWQCKNDECRAYNAGRKMEKGEKPEMV